MNVPKFCFVLFLFHLLLSIKTLLCVCRHASTLMLSPLSVCKSISISLSHLLRFRVSAVDSEDDLQNSDYTWKADWARYVYLS